MASTTFTINYYNRCVPYYLGGMRIQIRSFPEAASQTFVPGDLLVLNGTGSHKNNEVKLASSDPATAGQIVGFAVHGATGSEFTGWSGAGNGGAGSRTDSTALASANPSSLGPGIAGSLGQGMAASYVPPLTGSTAILSSSIGATKGLIQTYVATPTSLFVAVNTNGGSAGAISSDNIGLQAGFERDGTNLIWRVDDGDTATSGKSVVLVDTFDADGDTNGRYIFKFNERWLLYGGQNG